MINLKYSGIKLDVCGVEHTRLRTFCGSDTKINGRFIIQLPLNEKFFEVEPLVVKELPLGLILGQQFLRTFKEVTFSFKENCILLKNDDSIIKIPGPIMTEEDTPIIEEESDVERENIYSIVEQEREQVKAITQQINKPSSRKARKRNRISNIKHQQRQNEEIIAYLE